MFRITFCVIYPQIEPLVMPLIGDEVAVIPTHVFAADKIFVHLNSNVKRFEDFQYIAVQKVQLKQLSYIPSE